MEWTCCFGSKQFNFSHTKCRQDGKCEEDDADTTYPLSHTAPEQNPFGKYIYVVENGCSGRSETRHGFEECTCNIWNAVGQDEWYHTDE